MGPSYSSFLRLEHEPWAVYGQMALSELDLLGVTAPLALYPDHSAGSFLARLPFIPPLNRCALRCVTPGARVGG